MCCSLKKNTRSSLSVVGLLTLPRGPDIKQVHISSSSRGIVDHFFFRFFINETFSAR
jgi:hypothetical protein